MKQCNDDVNGINQVSETNYLGLSLHLAEMLIHGMKILVCFHAIYSHLAILFCREALFLQVWVIPTLARVVIKKMARIILADFIIISVKTLLLMTERAISVIHWHAFLHARGR